MIVIADTSALLAVFRADDPDHDRAAACYGASGNFAYSPLVAAELDLLLQQRIGYEAALAAFAEIGSRIEHGLDEFAQLEADDYLDAHRLRCEHRDMALDLADVLAVVVARKYDTDQLFTLNERVFGRLRPDGTAFEHFQLLPAGR